LRAAGFAAAAVALVASASSPSLAVDLDGAPRAGFAAHETAHADESDLALDDAAPAPSRKRRSGLLATPGTSAIVVRHAIAWLGRDKRPAAVVEVVPTPPSLGELVKTLASDVTGDLQQECLARAVYFEARGEPIQGQLAVAEVVLNRAASGKYPGTACAVITQKAQFSFIRHGRFPKADRKSAAWRKAVAVARIAKGGMAQELSPDVLWYHATYVAPSWGRRLNRETQIGLHIFYS
jgi:hypothetical protein